MHCDGERGHPKQRDRIEVGDRIVVGAIGSDADDHLRPHAAKETGVAVGPRAGGRRGPAAAPSPPPAPPMFSTTTVPRSDFILSAQGRPTASFTPPVVNGITSRIGRSGYFDWARRRRGSACANSVARPSANTSRRRIVHSPCVFVSRHRPKPSVKLQSDALDHWRPAGDFLIDKTPRLIGS